MKRRIFDSFVWLLLSAVVLTAVEYIIYLICGLDINEKFPEPFHTIWLVITILFLVGSAILYRTRIEPLHVKIKYFNDDAGVDIKGDLIDLRASEDVEMKAGEFKLIPLGVAMKLPRGYMAKVYPRSSTYKNLRILLANSTGIIDSDFCGPNDMWRFPAIATEDTVIHKGDRICQFEIVPIMDPIKFEIVKELEDKDRGGIGSTGVR